jgi:hypothetical protein
VPRARVSSWGARSQIDRTAVARGIALVSSTGAAVRHPASKRAPSSPRTPHRFAASPWGRISDGSCGSTASIERCSLLVCLPPILTVKADALLLARASVGLAVWPAHVLIGLDHIGDATRLALFLGSLGASREQALSRSQILTPFWFRCPGCGQGCRVLYGVNSLRCRKCRRLKYQSQYEMPAFRLLERARKIRRRLGAPGEWGSTGPLPPKPRYMRWRRYRRLEQLVWRLEAAGWAAMSVHVGGMRRRMR